MLKFARLCALSLDIGVEAVSTLLSACAVTALNVRRDLLIRGHDRRAVHQLVDADTLFLEFGKILAFELPLARHLNRHRIDKAIVDENLEVHVRTRR